MALIKCSECGKQISDKAKKCPNCGCENILVSSYSQTDFNNSNSFIRNNWFYFAVVFVAGAIYLILFVFTNLKEDEWYSSVETKKETYKFSDGILYENIYGREVAIGNYSVKGKTVQVQEDYKEDKDYTCSIKFNKKIVCNTEYGLETYKVMD